MCWVFHLPLFSVGDTNVKRTPNLANGLTFSNYFALLLDFRHPSLAGCNLQTVWPWPSKMQASTDLIPANTWYVSKSQNTQNKTQWTLKKTHPLCFHVRIINLRQLCFRNWGMTWYDSHFRPNSLSFQTSRSTSSNKSSMPVVNASPSDSSSWAKEMWCFYVTHLESWRSWATKDWWC